MSIDLEINDLRKQMLEYQQNFQMNEAFMTKRRIEELEHYKRKQEEMEMHRYGTSIVIPRHDLYYDTDGISHFPDPRGAELLKMLTTLEGVQTKDELIEILSSVTDEGIKISQLIEIWHVLRHISG